MCKCFYVNKNLVKCKLYYFDIFKPCPYINNPRWKQIYNNSRQFSIGRNY